MRIMVGVVAVALTAGCKKVDNKPAVSSAPAAVSVAKLDALWALAPKDAVGGVVMSPAGLASLEAAALGLKQTAASIPQAASVVAELEAELEKALGTKTPRLADAGLSADKGAALFFAGDDLSVIIVPVADRAKFVAVTKGTSNGDVDTIGDATCKQVKGVYACAKVAAVLDTLGGAKLPEALKLAGPRADIEAAGTVPGAGIRFGAGLQPTRGAFVLRGAVEGVPDKVLSQMPPAVKPRIAGNHTVGFGAVNLTAVTAALPALEIVPGVALDALGRTVNGPLTMSIAAGETMFDIRLPLADPALAKQLVAQCDQLPPLAPYAKVDNGICHLVAPVMNMAADVWVDGNTLRLGQRGSRPASAAVPMTALGREIADGEWSLALWGRGSVLAIPALPPLPSGTLPPDALIGLRSMIALNEMGLAMRRDGNTLRFILGVRTAWSNPDDVLAKLAAIPATDLLDGKANQTGKAIADGAPSSPFAADYKAGFGGVMAISASAGLLAAVAIPAFMDYMKKSKVSEASLNLNKLAKNLKVLHAESGAFPKGTAPATPATSCCDGPNRKCVDPAAWQQPLWTELEFAQLEPHQYRYTYESDGKVATVKALGDLDCDGVDAAWTLTVTASDTGASAQITAPPPGTY